MDSHLNAWIRALERTAPYGRNEGATLPEIIRSIAATQGDRPALLADHETLSYTELAAAIARTAHWALRQRIAPGETVALIMENCPAYAALWLGIISVRGVVALINPHLTGDALLHALAAARPTHIIAGPAQADALAALHDCPPIPSWSYGPHATWHDIRPVLAAGPDTPPPAAAPALSDVALYIYTSGTTGLPKAARVSHRRVAEWACWFAGLIDTQPTDRMYNCLPMYHSVGGVVAVGAMLVGGGSVVIREKFSASRFWPDIAEHGCTVFQYIGELCRYLVNSPVSDAETKHQLRLCCGNGLRGDVWPAFQARFKIPRILEFYASTEGNVSLYNIEGRPGAIGRVPSFLTHRFPVALIQCDPATGTLLRDANGLCRSTPRGEPGEALGRIADGAAAGRPFEGYTNEHAGTAKIARDVLAPGDAWYRTGDLMRQDRNGFYYFVDRLGENYRWKGENIATEEVADALRTCHGVTEAVVYGVAVPGTEGRAGMAALTVTADFDLATFYHHITTHLPDYARPVFLRIAAAIAATATFKPAKALLAREGYDPRGVTDKLYVRDTGLNEFVPLTQQVHHQICDASMRL
jgi:fatty-acyl-CoA synthase